jgi:hypothetical protein
MVSLHATLRRTLVRSLACAQALLFPLAATREALVHERHHGGLPAEASAPTAPAEHRHGRDPGPGPEPAPGHHGPERCTCIGVCHGAAAAPLPLAPAPLPLPLPPVRGSKPLPLGDEDLPGPPAFTLPYANAPPAA